MPTSRLIVWLALLAAAAAPHVGAEIAQVSPWTIQQVREDAKASATCQAGASFMILPGNYFVTVASLMFVADGDGNVLLRNRYEQPPPAWLFEGGPETAARPPAVPRATTRWVWFDEGPRWTVVATDQERTTQYSLGPASMVLDRLERAQVFNVGATSAPLVGGASGGPTSDFTAGLDQTPQLAQALRQCAAALRAGRPYESTTLTRLIDQERALDPRPLSVQLAEARSAARAVAPRATSDEHAAALVLRWGTLAAEALRWREAQEALTSIARADAGAPRSAVRASALAALFDVLMQLEQFDDAERVARQLPDIQARLAAVFLGRGAVAPGESTALDVIGKAIGRPLQTFQDLAAIPGGAARLPPPADTAVVRATLLAWAAARLGQEDMTVGAAVDSFSPGFQDVPAFAVAEQVFRWVDPRSVSIDSPANRKVARELGMAAYLRGESLRRAGLPAAVAADLSYAGFELKAAREEGHYALVRVAQAAQLADLGLLARAKAEIEIVQADISTALGRESQAWIESAMVKARVLEATGDRTGSLRELGRAQDAAAAALPLGHSLVDRVLLEQARLARIVAPASCPVEPVLRRFGLVTLPEVDVRDAATLRRAVREVTQEQDRAWREEDLKKLRRASEIEAELRTMEQFARQLRAAGAPSDDGIASDVERLRKELLAAQAAERVANTAGKRTADGTQRWEALLRRYDALLGLNGRTFADAAAARAESEEWVAILTRCAAAETKAARREGLSLLSERTQLADLNAQLRGFAKSSVLAGAYRGILRRYAEGRFIGRSAEDVKKGDVRESMARLSETMSVLNVLHLTELLPSELRTALRPKEAMGLEILLSDQQRTFAPTNTTVFDAGLPQIQAATRGEVLAELAHRVMLDPSPQERPELQDLTASRRAVQGESWLRRERAFLREAIATAATEPALSPTRRAEVRRRYLGTNYTTQGVRTTVQSAFGIAGSRARPRTDAYSPNTTMQYTLSSVAYRQRLGSHEAVVIWLPVGRSLHTMVIRGDRTRWLRAEVPRTKIAAQVAAVRGSIATAVEDVLAGRPTVAAFDASNAHALYAELISPIEADLEGVTHLYTAQLAETGAMPLQILRVDNPDRDATPRWLGDRFAITRMPALVNPRVFDQRTTSRADGGPRPAFAGFGAPVLGSNEPGAGVVRFAGRSLPSLGNAAAELRSIARILGEEDLARSVATGNSATRRFVLDRLARPSPAVLMFATHGLVGAELPGIGEPALLLTRDPANLADDGLLRASDVVGLHITSDLVLLSACSTAVSGEDGAEPLAGLASAFLIAGARAVLASQWTVEDAATARLTTGVVTAQRERGRSAAEALQESARTVRSDPRTAHPLFWGAFEVIGMPRMHR